MFDTWNLSGSWPHAHWRISSFQTSFINDRTHWRSRTSCWTCCLLAPRTNFAPAFTRMVLFRHRQFQLTSSTTISRHLSFEETTLCVTLHAVGGKKDTLSTAQTGDQPWSASLIASKTSRRWKKGILQKRHEWWEPTDVSLLQTRSARMVCCMSGSQCISSVISSFVQRCADSPNRCGFSSHVLWPRRSEPLLTVPESTVISTTSSSRTVISTSSQSATSSSVSSTSIGWQYRLVLGGPFKFHSAPACSHPVALNEFQSTTIEPVILPCDSFTELVIFLCTDITESAVALCITCAEPVVPFRVNVTKSISLLWNKYLTAKTCNGLGLERVPSTFLPATCVTWLEEIRHSSNQLPQKQGGNSATSPQSNVSSNMERLSKSSCHRLKSARSQARDLIAHQLDKRQVFQWNTLRHRLKGSSSWSQRRFPSISGAAAQSTRRRPQRSSPCQNRPSLRQSPTSARPLWSAHAALPRHHLASHFAPAQSPSAENPESPRRRNSARYVERVGLLLEDFSRSPSALPKTFGHRIQHVMCDVFC